MGVKVRWYRAAYWIFVNHKNRRKSKRIGDNKGVAETVAARVQLRLTEGDLSVLSEPEPSDAPILLRAYVAQWLTQSASTLKASTLAGYTDKLNGHVLPLLGDCPVSSLTRADCRKLITVSRDQKGLRLNTVKGIVRSLGACLSQAVEDRLLEANPTLNLKRYLRRGDEAETEMHPFTRADADHLLATAQEHFPRWHPYILTALRTGLRPGEMLGLQWGDLNLHNGTLTVRRALVRGHLTTPKNKRRRTVDLSPQLVEALVEWRRQQRERWLKKGQPMPEWVFPSLEGTPLILRNVRHVYKRLVEKAELGQRTLYDTRHTFASQLLQAGASIPYVAQQMGHGDPSITLKVYAHWLPEATRRDVDLLDTQNASIRIPDASDHSEEDLAASVKSFAINGAPGRT